jgi:bacillithiol system protein YtxJ
MSNTEQHSADFVPVKERSELDELFRRSNEHPVVLFKHSSMCSISADTYQEMTHYPGRVELIVIQQTRSLSDEIENRTGLRHESPQVIVLSKGKPVFHESHWRIKADAVAQAVKEHS